MKRARVLVADDKESFLALFRRIVPSDVDIVCVSDGMRAIELLRRERFDLVVSDIRMPGLDGLGLLRRIRDMGIDVEVVLMTAYGTIADAVRAMKYGAADYLTKPFDPDDAVAAIEQALARRSERALRSTAHAPKLLGESPAIKRLLDLIERAAQSEVPVLITGESGTGKELIASIIHAESARSTKRLFSVNCGALASERIEAELFGQVPETAPRDGATVGRPGLFAQASGGTLFLDEVHELPAAVQVQLARVLQHGTVRKVGAVDDQIVDVRVIAASHVDLQAAVAEGRYREELLQRLRVLSIEVPPLRERREDIPLLSDALLARLTGPRGRPRRLSAEALLCLSSYHWPGNVRQLGNALARAAAVATDEELGVEALPAEVRGGDVMPPRPPTTIASLPYREAIASERERATREYLVALLHDVNGNVTQAAERAGIERESFHRLMKRHRVRAEDYRPRGGS